MGKYRPSGVIYVAGQKFHVEAPVVNFTEGPRWDATAKTCLPTDNDGMRLCTSPEGFPSTVNYNQRYALRPALRHYGEHPPLEAVKAVIKQFVVHHDGCSSSDMCFDVLQNERGLSVHFMVDNDGTIFQTIDLALMAYHAAEWNTASIGVELCNRGDWLKEPHYYDGGRFGPLRAPKLCRINGHTFKAFEYTKPQMESFRALCRDLIRILPNLPTEFPQSSPGEPMWDTMPTAASFGFAGFIGHYHLTAQKWDPGPFDFKDFCRSLRGSFCFPLYNAPDPKRAERDIPAIPTDPDKLQAAATELFKNNETRADGGYFPVGPWGEARLWHGGVHLVGKEGDPIYAPFPGRLVAARMGKNAPIGSVNFVLLRHDMALGKSKVQFYSLYMHLADELAGAGPRVDWMTSKNSGWKQNGRPGEVSLLDEPVEAGALIGHMGTAGPAELSRAQIHLEFFATSELFTDVPGSPWTVVDGTSSGRFCEAIEINNNIDTDHDGTLSRQELSSFYSGGGGEALHHTVTLNISEWTTEPSWSEALRVPKDFKKWKAADIDDLVDNQITPGLWWDAATAAHCKLSPDGVVFHYHPVTFLAWFNQQLLDAAAQAKKTGKDLDERDATKVPPTILGDYDDVSGKSMRSAATVEDDPCNKLTLSDMVLGYDAPECGQ